MNRMKDFGINGCLVASVVVAALWTGEVAFAAHMANGARAPTLNSLDDVAQKAHSRDSGLVRNPRISPDLKALDDRVQYAHRRGGHETTSPQPVSESSLGNLPAPTLDTLDDGAQKAHSRKPGLIKNPHISPALREIDDTAQEAHSR